MTGMKHFQMNQTTRREPFNFRPSKAPNFLFFHFASCLQFLFCFAYALALVSMSCDHDLPPSIVPHSFQAGESYMTLKPLSFDALYGINSQLFLHQFCVYVTAANLFFADARHCNLDCRYQFGLIIYNFKSCENDKYLQLFITKFCEFPSNFCVLASEQHKDSVLLGGENSGEESHLNFFFISFAQLDKLYKNLIFNIIYNFNSILKSEEFKFLFCWI